MSPRQLSAEPVSDPGADHGEGPLWHPRDRRLDWVDITAGRLHRFDPATGTEETIDVGSNAQPTERLAQVPAAIDLYESPEGYLLVADFPGVRPEDVHVELERNELRLSGVRRLEAGNKTLARTFGSAELRRTVRLPEDVEADGVIAEFKSGVLHLTIPKSANLRPRKIAIQAA